MVPNSYALSSSSSLVRGKESCTRTSRLTAFAALSTQALRAEFAFWFLFPRQPMTMGATPTLVCPSIRLPGRHSILTLLLIVEVENA
jgi:hypothetical protein